MRILQRTCRAAMCVVAALMLACSLVPAGALGALGAGPHAGIAVAAEADDQKAAQKAVDLIAALPAASDASVGDRAAADAASAAYAALTAGQKALVTNKDKLDAVLAAVQAAEDAAARAAEEEAARRAAEEEAARKAAEEEEIRRRAEEDAKKNNKRTLVDMDLYVTATNSFGEWGKELDRANEGTYDKPEWRLKDGIKDKGGQVKLLVYAYWSGGRACRQDDRENWLDVDLQYESSDKRVATVSNNGVVTAVGDGDVEVTATDRDSGLKAGIRIRVSGQAGPLVTELWVCDATGRQYEEERIPYSDFSNPLALYVREVFSDGTTASNAPQAADCAPDGMTEVTWSVNSDMAKVSAGAGTLTATKEAREAATTSVTVTAQATGGDPDVNQGVVRTHAYVRIQGSGVPTSSRLAADSLTVHVIYDEYPDYTVATRQWSLAELQSLESVNSTYTLTRSDGGYVTASGSGIYLTTLIEQMNLKNEQVKSFTFTANDGVNPGKMTYGFLFGERYWWPNYEFGGNRSGAVNVFPMLAWASDWRESSSGAANCDADYSNLNDNARLRLLFGSETNSDNKTDHSLKYISEMTIRIDGAPDITSGGGEDGKNSDGKDRTGDNRNTVGPGNNGGSQNGSTTGGSIAPGGGDPNDGRTAADAARAVGGEVRAAAAGAATSVADNDSTRDTRGENAAAAASSSSQKWRVYQMMNPFDETDYQIQELDDNPLAGYLPYLLALMLLLGGAERWLNFKRETGLPMKARMA